MFALVALICLMLGIVWKIVKENHRYVSLTLKIPSASSIPIIGDLLLMAPYRFDVIQGLKLTTRQYGDIFKIWTGKLLVIVSSPEDMEIICMNPAAQDRGSVLYGFSVELGPKSLMVSNWNLDAKLTKKAFHRNFNASSQEIIFEHFRKANNKLLKTLESKVGEWFDIGQHIKVTTSTAIFGAALDANFEEYPAVKRLLHQIEELGFSLICRGISELHKNDLIYYQLLGGKQVAAIIEGTKQEIRQIVLQKKKTLTDMMEKRQDIPNQFIYNILQEISDCVDTEEVVQGICTLLLTALHTSAVTAAFTLLMLAMHPEIQQLIYEEDQKIQQELNGQDLNERNIAKYEYLSLVIKEVLRMYPPVPIMPRVLNEDIQFGKFVVPKGASVLGSVLSLHRDPKVYNMPSVFNPERFRLENFKEVSKYAYIPFGGGPRNCPGLKYGTHSAIFIVTSIIRNFKIYTKFKSTEELDSNLEFVTTINAKGGFPLCIERRIGPLLELTN